MAETRIRNGESLEQVAGRTGTPVNELEINSGRPITGAKVKFGGDPASGRTLDGPKTVDAAERSIDVNVDAPSPQEFAAKNRAASTLGADRAKAGVQSVTPVGTLERPTPTRDTIATSPIAGFSDVRQPRGGFFEPDLVTPVQTTNLFNQLKSGQLDPRDLQTKKNITESERQALAIHSSFQGHKNLTGEELFQSIQNGTITPDPDNVLWNALYDGGAPTESQIEAFAKWEKLQDKTQDRQAFLKGELVEETVDDKLNKTQDELKGKEDAGDVPVDEAVDIVEEGVGSGDGGTSGDDFVITNEDLRGAADRLIGMINAKPLPASDFEANQRRLLGEFGINERNARISDMRQELIGLDENRRARTNAQKDKTLSMGVISGRIGEIEAQENERRTVLSDEIQAETDALNAAFNVSQSIQQAHGLDYNSSIKNYQTEFQNALAGINQLQSLSVEDRQRFAQKRTLENQRRDDARANMQVLYNNVGTGALSLEDLTPEQTTQIRQIEAQAGLPAGTFQTLKSIAPDSQIVGQGKQRVKEDGTIVYDYVMQDSDGKLSVKSVETGQDFSKMPADKAEQAKEIGDAAVAELRVALDSGNFRGQKLSDDERRVIELTLNEIDAAVQERGGLSEKEFENLQKEQSKTVTALNTRKNKLIDDIDKIRAEKTKTNQFGVMVQLSPAAKKAIDERIKSKQDQVDAIDEEIEGVKKKSKLIDLPDNFQSNTSDFFGNFGVITGPQGSPKWKAGLDIDLKIGDPVVSPVNGKIIAVEPGNNGGFGNRIKIQDTRGNEIWLSHLRNKGFAVEVGDAVSAGEVVGLGGNTGSVIRGPGGDGSHLDITILKSGREPNFSNKGANDSFFTAPEVDAYVRENYGSDVAFSDSILTGDRDTSQFELSNIVSEALSLLPQGGAVDTAEDFFSKLDSIE